MGTVARAPKTVGGPHTCSRRMRQVCPTWQFWKVRGWWSRSRGAAFIGAFIAGAFGYSNAGGGIPWILLIIQIVVAAIGVAIVAGVYGRRSFRR